MQMMAISQHISHIWMSHARILQLPTMVEGCHYTSYITQTTHVFQTEVQFQPCVIFLVIIRILNIKKKEGWQTPDIRIGTEKSGLVDFDQLFQWLMAFLLKHISMISLFIALWTSSHASAVDLAQPYYPVHLLNKQNNVPAAVNVKHSTPLCTSWRWEW